MLGKDGKAPLKYKGCMEVATKVLAANKVEYVYWMFVSKVVFLQIPHFQIYFSGDPYVGPRTQELEKRKARITELEKENKALKDRIRELESR